MEWKYIDFDKIPEEYKTNDEHYNFFGYINKYKFKQILNYNKDIFFLLGDDSRIVSLIEPNSVVYSTTDFGDTWHKTSFGKGNVEYGAFVDKKLFVLVLSSNSPLSRVQKSSIYSSEDWGKTWKEEMINSKEEISEINFYSDKIWVASFIMNKDDWKEENRHTEDGGKTWKKIEANLQQFRPRYNCVFTSDSTLIYIENNTQLTELDLKTNQKKLVKNIVVPQDMELSDISIEQKTGETIGFYMGKELDNEKVAVYYIEKEEYIPLPDGYYASTYGDYYYALVFEKPFSTYVWSTDRGKTWATEKLDYIRLFTDMPKSYYGEGYIYIEASEGKNDYLSIGRPIIKE